MSVNNQYCRWTRVRFLLQLDCFALFLEHASQENTFDRLNTFVYNIVFVAGKVICTTITPEDRLPTSPEHYESKNLVVSPTEIVLNNRRNGVQRNTLVIMALAVTLHFSV